jgi:pantoate--beta-alanine ligase
MSMQIISTVTGMHALSRQFMAEGRTVGFVPTMGALHEGHLSLADRSKTVNDVTVVSIFVNPAQFGPQEDFNRYPRDREGDLNTLESLGAEVVFIPGEKEIYPEGFSFTFDIGDLGNRLCGASRPGHFNGVSLVITKLFNLVSPHRAYFGQKDLQQTVVIKKVVRELNFDTEVVVCPTVREPDGFAMSSRNRYLNKEQRKAAPVLFRALQQGVDLIEQGLLDACRVKKEMEATLESEPLSDIDYLAIVEPRELREIEHIERPVAICLAVRIGSTRLIDNVIVE